MHLWLFKQLNNWMHSPIFTLVTYWNCSLPVGTCTATIFNYIVWIVICIRLRSISIGFIWNSCFAIKLNKILMSLKSSFNYWIYIFKYSIFIYWLLILFLFIKGTETKLCKICTIDRWVGLFSHTQMWPIFWG